MTDCAPSKEDRIAFAKALVGAWNRGSSVLAALLQAANLPVVERRDDGTQTFFTGEEWDALCGRFGIAPRTFLRQDARRWIAAHYRNANAALWDGKQELAWKWIASGKDVPPTHARSARTEAREEMKKDYKGRLKVPARKHDWRRDWKVCK